MAGKRPERYLLGKGKSGLVGIYSKDVTEQDEHMRPQEHGNKRGVRWAIFMDDAGKGLRTEALDEPISISAWPYSLVQLRDAGRICNLPEYKRTTINLDCIQNGLGDSFVPVPSEYVIKEGECYQYKFRLSIVDGV